MSDESVQAIKVYGSRAELLADGAVELTDVEVIALLDRLRRARRERRKLAERGENRMSASEKLKALDAAEPLEKYEIDLFGVLPQIVAVVEAAEAMPAPQEHERHAGVPYLYARRHDCDSLRAALAALDEALS